jgi:O-antigen/teichoic acid export membrane protein
MFQTIYPRMSRLFAGGDLVDLNATYHLSTRFLAAIVFPVAMAMIVYAHDFLVLWVGNAGISARTAPILGLLAAGTAVNAVMHIPFALQLACGKVRLALVISVTLAVLIIPLIIILATQYGAIGGASAWFVLHVLYMFGGTWLTHRELLPGEGRKWLFGDVGVPLLTAALFGIGAATLHRFAGEAPMINLLLGSVITGACIVACIGSSSPARRILLSALHGNLHRKALGRLG